MVTTPFALFCFPHNKCNRRSCRLNSSVQDATYALGKGHVHSTLSLRGFSNIIFEIFPVFVWLMIALSCPFKEDLHSCHLVGMSCPLKIRFFYKDYATPGDAGQAVIVTAFNHPLGVSTGSPSPPPPTIPIMITYLLPNEYCFPDQSQLSVLTLISVCVPPPSYRSSMQSSRSFCQKCKIRLEPLMGRAYNTKYNAVVYHVKSCA